MQNAKLLIIDDEERLRKLLLRILQLEGYEVFEAASAKDGLKKLETEAIEVVISDVILPDSNGIELTQKIKTTWPETEVIVLTAFGSISDGVAAIKNGAFDYLVKGNDNDRIIPLLSKAVDKVRLQQRVNQLENQLNNRFGFERIIGQSEPIKAAINLAQKVAATDTTVLLLGETGTGKEVFAEAIHQASHRKQKAFLAVNCSAFTKELLESELFGYKAGAFTNALKDKKGLFEEASGGTIFLDEIGELDLNLQAKLLRVLESQQFIKIGDTRPTQVNVRIIAATNRDLLAETTKANFRADLYYRLSVFQITLPSLRNRKEDIHPLAAFFTGYFSSKVKKAVPVLSTAFLQKLENYAWPGNIRELKNVIERVVILSNNAQADVSFLPQNMQVQTAASFPGYQQFNMALMEKQHIMQVLKHAEGNRTETARLLDIGIATLYRKLKEYKLE